MYKEENTHCDYILWSSLLLVFFMTSNAVFLGSLEICFLMFFPTHRFENLKSSSENLTIIPWLSFSCPTIGEGI